MKAGKVVLPYAIFVIGLAVIYIGLVALRTGGPSTGAALPPVEVLVLLGVSGAAMLALLSLTPGAWLRARPTDQWRAKAQAADTAIVLGFGYVKGQDGKMAVDRANRALYLESLSAKFPGVTTLLVQESVLAAAQADDPESVVGEATTSGQLTRTVRIRRIHRHDPDGYLNTLETAFCAVDALRSAMTTRAILIAHPLQLDRAAADFNAVAEAIGAKIEFIIPEIPDIPFVRASEHIQTRNRFVWTLVELLLARARDRVSAMPHVCKLPVVDDEPGLIRIAAVRDATEDDERNFRALAGRPCPRCESPLSLVPHRTSSFRMEGSSDLYAHVETAKVTEVLRCTDCSVDLGRRWRYESQEVSSYASPEWDVGPWSYLYFDAA